VNVLVDSSVWIDYFRGSGSVDALDFLIDENLICTNELILTELIPFLRIKRQRKLIDLLQSVERLSLDIDWDKLIEFQVKCIRAGINKVGISDLVIAQNAIQHGATVFSQDKHFSLMSRHLPFSLFGDSE
jgi:predicted nucleic acid-binding protein